MEDYEERKRLETMLLDLGEHFRCQECGCVFHDYDRYAGLEDEKCCDKCGAREDRIRAELNETYESLRWAR